MKKRFFITAFALLGVLGFSQKSDIYKSSYNATMVVNNYNHLGLGVETSQGIRVLNNFILSANVSYTYFFVDKVNSLPVKADLKVYFNNLKKEKYFRPFFFLNAGSNINLGDSYLKGGSASVGLGLDVKIKDNTYNITIFNSYNGEEHYFWYFERKYDISSTGIKLGITF